MPYLLAATLLWAFSFGLIKGQLTGFDPVLVASGRLLLATLVFSPLILRSRLNRPLVWRALVLGAVQFGVMYMLYIASYAWLPAWMVALFTIFTPLYVILLNDIARRRFAVRHLLAAVAAVAGAALVVRGNPEGADWRGVLLLQGANLCFAFGQLRFVSLQAEAKGKDAILAGWMYLGAFILTGLVFAFRLVMSSGAALEAHWPTSALLALVYLGVLPTGLGFYLWNRGAARTSAGRLAVSNNLKVPLAVLVSWLVFGEQVPLGWVVAGLVVILAGLILVEPRRSRA